MLPRISSLISLSELENMITTGYATAQKRSANITLMKFRNIPIVFRSHRRTITTAIKITYPTSFDTETVYNSKGYNTSAIMKAGRIRHLRVDFINS